VSLISHVANKCEYRRQFIVPPPPHTHRLRALTHIFKCDCRPGMSKSLVLMGCSETRDSDVGLHNLKNIQKGTVECIMGVLDWELHLTVVLLLR
jgi:hypothetical protein